ncbi:hypothetical protein AORI_7473 [Amycolatopsis keratiniphila]|uniref:Uncharacterized protein n=1 Tax=Amycolatopsis keratiniphila TaxID=129921 RepID=R4T5E6_9PSEU|nr:hypothetical protein AORI_7473 [Amycolatopsis keratiniphila]
MQVLLLLPTFAPSTCWVPPRRISRLRCRPSVMCPPRLFVNCWPVSIQPRVSMWKFWIERDAQKACSSV